VISADIPNNGNLYQNPGGPIIGQLRDEQMLYDLHESMVFQGLVWTKVMDEDGRVGWLPQIYLLPTTPTSTTEP
jgi:hypothetical protein